MLYSTTYRVVNMICISYFELSFGMLDMEY